MVNERKKALKVTVLMVVELADLAGVLNWTKEKAELLDSTLTAKN